MTMETPIGCHYPLMLSMLIFPMILPIRIRRILLGGIPTPLKNDGVSQYMKWKIKFMGYMEYNS